MVEEKEFIVKKGQRDAEKTGIWKCAFGEIGRKSTRSKQENPRE